MNKTETTKLHSPQELAALARWDFAEFEKCRLNYAPPEGLIEALDSFVPTDDMEEMPETAELGDSWVRVFYCKKAGRIKRVLFNPSDLYHPIKGQLKIGVDFVAGAVRHPELPTSWDDLDNPQRPEKSGAA